MRKPLVVVCVGASAVLLAGAIAATAAGAGTTPDAPQAPGLVVPALPGTEPPAAPPVTGQDVPGPELPGLSASPGGPTAPAGQTASPHRGGGRPTGEPDTPATTRPAPAKPGDDAPADRPAPAPQKPDRQPDVAPDGASPAVQHRAAALVNEARRDAGCGDVTVDRRLIEAADRHAADMARRGYFAHRSPGGADAGDRVRDAGYRWSRYGENIARGQQSIDEVVDGWLHSPEHRENILDCELTQMGIGRADASDRTPYWVQNFATPQ